MTGRFARSFIASLAAVASLASGSALAGRGNGRGNRNQTPKPATPAAAASSNTGGAILPDPTPPPAGSVHAEGDYSGVAPDHPGKPDGQKQKRPATGTLSWIGFEAKDGGAQVFLQSVAAFELAQHVEGNTLVAFAALSRLGQNTWRDVDTRYFDSPIAHIVARHVGAARATKAAPAHGAGIEVRISFKSPKDAHEAAVRTATEADGLYYAYLAFGGATGGAGGDAPAAGSATTVPDDPEK